MKSYLELEAIFNKINAVNNASAILHWDNAVMMPGGGVESRAEQLAVLAGISHNLLVSQQVKDLISQSSQYEKELDDWQKANLREMKRQVKHAVAIPEQLVEAFSKASSNCEMIWREKRAVNDFKGFIPSFKEVVKLVQEIATIKSEQFGCSKYDALLDEYDPGQKSAYIDEVFAGLEEFLPDFIKMAIDNQASKKPPLPIKGHFDIEKQKSLGVECMKALGFDFNSGRLDISTHPFCGGVPGDVRITTRYYKDNFLPSLMGILHETGHALYENNLPKKYIHQPIGSAAGMSIHESQSLMVEMQIASSKDFITYLQPLLIKHLGLSGEEYSVENIYHIINNVQPSLIRVDADEATYPAHILMRYKIEKAIIENRLAIEDLPDIWQSEMQRLLGIKVLSDKDGCMQDIHWPSGLFGYFPCYSFGAMIAAQLFEALKQELPNISALIKDGHFKPIISWLSENIHQYGRKYPSGELVKVATGKNLDVEIFKNYLRKKFLT